MTVTVIGDNTGDDYAGTEDTQVRIYSTVANTNYGTTTPLEITFWTSSDQNHSLLKFSGLSNISASDTVSAATLAIYISTTSTPAGYYGDARRLLRNWVVSEATGNNYSTGNAWTTVGGVSDGNDRSATIDGSIPLNTASAYASISDANLVTTVQNFVDGTWANYGWHLDADNAVYNYTAKFISEEGSDGSRPYLSVTHAASGGSLFVRGGGEGGLAGMGGLAGIHGGLAG